MNGLGKTDLPARIPGGPITVPWVTSGLLLLALLTWFTGTADWFEYHAGAIGRGEYWRLFTGHFTHLTASHLVWDGLVFLALGMVLECWNRRLMAVVVGASAVLITLALPVLIPGLVVYRGLSGIDTALFVCLATLLAAKAYRTHQATILVIVQASLAGLASKVAFEYLTGQSLFVGNGLTPVPAAHLVGGTVGFLLTLFEQGGACVEKRD